MGPGETPGAPATSPRVLLLIKGLGLGGAERLLLDVVHAADAGRVTYEVAFVLAEQGALAPDFAAAGVPVHPLGARSSADVRWTWALRRLLVRGRFDVLHAHLPYSASFGRLVALSLPRRRRPALVYTEHSLWDRAAVLTKALNTTTAAADDALLVVSAAARAALPRRLQAGARVVTHGIDRSRFALAAPARASTRQAVRAELGVGDAEVLALTVSNVRREKGYDVLLDAARRVAERGAPVRFVTAGRGELDGDLTEAAAEARATGRFTFLGMRTDTDRLMTAADIFVLPSHQEGLPVALMEAMSSGLPVVATAVGGVPGVVTDDVEGFVVPPANPGALADAVMRVAADEPLRRRLGAAARATSAQFDVRHAARAIEDVYAELVARRRAPRDHPTAGHGGTVTPPLVLHVIPTAAARGAQREARALASRLDVPGVRHHRLLSMFAGPGGVPVDVALSHPARRPGVGFDPRLVRRLRAVLGELDPAVVVAHGGDPLKYLVPALAGARRPLAYYATGTFEHAARRSRVRMWRVLVRRADVVACEGQEVLDECRRLFGVPAARSLLAPNGRDTDQFHPPARRHGARVPGLVFVGALTTGKRPMRFVEVVAQLRARGVPLRAVMCGDGPLAAELAAPAQDAEVELLGSRPDVAVVLRDADVLVFPSLPTGEGMPGVLIEAGLSGLPVVATAVPGVASVVQDGVTGFVVAPDDERAMVDATATLLGDSALRARMGEAARTLCAEQFSLEAVAACWLGFLEPLVACARPPVKRAKR